MKIHALLACLAFFSFASGSPGSAEAGQESARSWGKPACGLKVSIAVDKTHRSQGSSFVVSVVIANISGAGIDLGVIPAFKLGIASKASPRSTQAFGDYWCPVNFNERKPGPKTGPIIASPSRLIMEKGASIRTTMDLTRHGWDKIISSWWPARDFDSVVGLGKYILRLDIQVNGSAEPKWVRSNEIGITIGNPAE